MEHSISISLKKQSQKTSDKAPKNQRSIIVFKTLDLQNTTISSILRKRQDHCWKVAPAVTAVVYHNII